MSCCAQCSAACCRPRAVCAAVLPLAPRAAHQVQRRAVRQAPGKAVRLQGWKSGNTSSLPAAAKCGASCPPAAQAQRAAARQGTGALLLLRAGPRAPQPSGARPCAARAKAARWHAPTRMLYDTTEMASLCVVARLPRWRTTVGPHRRRPRSSNPRPSSALAASPPTSAGRPPITLQLLINERSVCCRWMGIAGFGSGWPLACTATPSD